MDEKNYLWLRFFARTFDALLYIFLFFILALLIRPINDYILYFYANSPQYSLFQLRIISFTLSICEFYVFIVSIDLLIYYFTGNNVGKMILGIKIVNADTGNKLSLTEYSDRTMRQMFSGFCLGIPVLCFITFFIQYNIVFQKNRASYDKKVILLSDNQRAKLSSGSEKDDMSSEEEKLNQSFNDEEADRSSTDENTDLSSENEKANLSSDDKKAELPSEDKSDIANKIVRQPIPIFNYIFFAAVYIFLFLSIGFTSKINLGIYPY